MKKRSREPKPLIPLMQPLLMIVVFFCLMHESDFFPDIFGVKSIRHNDAEMMSALYLQVIIVSQALIFVTKSRSLSYVERPGMLLLCAFVIAQLVVTLIAVYADWSFAKVKGCGWGWAGVTWIYSAVFYVLLGLMKFVIRYILSGGVRQNLQENKTAFTSMKDLKDLSNEETEARWAHAQRTLHVLNQPEEASNNIFNEKNNYREMSEIASGIAEQAKKLAEIARLHELYVLKGTSSQS